MRWFHLAVIAMFVAITIIFAAQNFQMVTVSFLRISASTPLTFLIIVIYLLGAVSGGSLLALLRWFIEGAKLRSSGGR